jgi:hypothetical protein
LRIFAGKTAFGSNRTVITTASTFIGSPGIVTLNTESLLENATIEWMKEIAAHKDATFTIAAFALINLGRTFNVHTLRAYGTFQTTASTVVRLPSTIGRNAQWLAFGDTSQHVDHGPADKGTLFFHIIFDFSILILILISSMMLTSRKSTIGNGFTPIQFNLIGSLKDLRSNFFWTFAVAAPTDVCIQGFLGTDRNGHGR